MWEENCKTLMKEIIGDLNKSRDSPYSWIPILLNVIHSKCNPIQNPSMLFCRYWQADAKIDTERPKSQNIQQNVKEQSERTGFIWL